VPEVLASLLAIIVPPSRHSYYNYCTSWNPPVTIPASVSGMKSVTADRRLSPDA